jgi:hypothetical protein
VGLAANAGCHLGFEQFWREHKSVYTVGPAGTRTGTH